MFRDVSIDSQLYYWFISGDQTSTVEWEVVLKEEVDEAALETAVADVMSIFVNFRSHPVIIYGRLKISGEGEDVPIYWKYILKAVVFYGIVLRDSLFQFMSLVLMGVKDERDIQKGEEVKTQENI